MACCLRDREKGNVAIFWRSDLFPDYVLHHLWKCAEPGSRYFLTFLERALSNGPAEAIARVQLECHRFDWILIGK